MVDIARKPEHAPRPDQTAKQGEALIRDETPLIVPTLRPRVGIEQKGPPDTLLGQHAKQVHGIIIIEADIRYAACFNLGQQLCHSVDKRLASDKPDGRIGQRLRKQMLPAAETDF